MPDETPPEDLDEEASPEEEDEEPEAEPELTDEEKAKLEAAELAARVDREKVADAERAKPDKKRGITREKRPGKVVHGTRVTDVVQVVTTMKSVPGGVVVSTPHVPKPMPVVQTGHMVHTRNPAVPHPDLKLP